MQKKLKVMQRILNCKKGYIHIDDVYRLIAGHSNYHGDNILSALTCIAEGKNVTKPITPLDEEDCSNDNVQNCFNEILDYMNDKSVTWRDISDDIINDILKKYGFKQE